MPSELLGALFLVLLLVLIVCGIPVYLVLWVLSIVGLWIVTGFSPAVNALVSGTFHVFTNYSFSVAIFFILMGSVVAESGIVDRLFDSVGKLIPRLPGLHYVVTILAAAAFGACCGSTAASSAGFTKIALRPMIDKGYNRSLSAGIIAVAGTLATMIPPSVLMIVFCIITEVPVGKMFLAGYVPGIITALAYAGFTIVLVKVKPSLAPAGSEVAALTTGARLKALFNMWPVAVLAVVIMGGFFSGIYTSTEIGAASAVAAFVIAVILKGWRRVSLNRAASETVHTCAFIFVIMGGAIVFARFLAISGITAAAAGWITSLHVSPRVVILGMLGVYLVLGCFIDEIGMMAITLPIFFPIVEEFGVDPVWFGILVIGTMELGLATPPFGINVFVTKAAAGDLVTMEEVFRGAMPYIGVLVVVEFILWLFPGIVTWLPSVLG